ncbi:MAG: ribosome biogenesis GTPase Der [Candidatus Omnitrophica bacterium]|nr:GTPase Der [bacterium]NUN96180.1 ribosome biogenesis GTPase Der [Candidatus Omnitrophota bacterium]
MSKAPYTVAIVGRPNVGKSTLFNRLVGHRVSIVDDRPGVTRDVIARTFEWNGVPIRFLDTGGYETSSSGEIEVNVRRHIAEAVELADALVLVVDITTGPTAEDEEAVGFVRRCGRPLVLAVNKADTAKREQEGLADFLHWGFDRVETVSALHGTGTGDLLDAIVEMLPDRPAEIEAGDDEKIIRVALVGRPNVGKSTLLNRMVGHQRSLVSSIPGTTRDPVDTLVEHDGQLFLLVDTAGIRRRGKIKDIEKFAVTRGLLAIDRADVVLLLIDASEGLTETDAHVFGLAHEAGRAAVIVANKWDLVEKDSDTAGASAKDIYRNLKFLRHCPIQFISAQTGQRVPRLWDEIRKVHTAYSHRISTPALNERLKEWVNHRPPHGIRGILPKILYITQVSTKPPTFALFVRNPQGLHLTYKRYLVNRMRETFDFTGTPIRLLVRENRGRGKLETPGAPEAIEAL